MPAKYFTIFCRQRLCFLLYAAVVGKVQLHVVRQLGFAELKFVAVYGADRSSDGNSRIIDKIFITHNIVTAQALHFGYSVVKEVLLTYHPKLSRVGEGLYIL